MCDGFVIALDNIPIQDRTSNEKQSHNDDFASYPFDLDLTLFTS